MSSIPNWGDGKVVLGRETPRREPDGLSCSALGGES